MSARPRQAPGRLTHPAFQRGRWRLALLVPLLLLAGLTAWLVWPAAPVAVSSSTPAHDSATLERGRYLATLGNCQHCHTPRGAPPYSGGRGISTPFGTVYSSNLTPSPAGLGLWSADDFWRALHHGQSRDGRWLYPAFPYTNTTHISRSDSDALYAYLRTLTPDQRTAPAHQLSWPYNTQAALKVWRALYFRAGPEPLPQFAAEAAVSDLQRGAYLVRGLGHCSACHAPRNALGGHRDMLDLTGGLMATQNWYAPSLNDPQQAGVQDWPLHRIVELFQIGRSGQAFVSGPMAEVVQHSTQFWRRADLQAMALYLQQLPRTPAPPAHSKTPARLSETGARLYERHCADCHGPHGQGVRGHDGQYAYPPLAGNRTVTQPVAANLVHIVLQGGFAPATPGHPRPFGMPPFVLSLSDQEVADVLSYLRTAWGNQAAAVSPLDVQQWRHTSAP